MLSGSDSGMIELHGVTKIFGTRGGEVAALRDIDLRIERGEMFGIAGRSGAGKSTLLRCLNLLERPTSGTVSIAGEEITALSPARLRAARRKIGMVFQHFNLLAQRTVFDNIALPLELAGTSKAQIAAAVEPLLAFVGLEAVKDRYPAQLSGGQKQRVGIARALANQPDLLLCDEATSALDTETTASILDLLRDVNRRFGVTIVLITHELSVIERICDRVAILDRGGIVELGPVRTVFDRPTAAATRALLYAGSGDSADSGEVAV